MTPEEIAALKAEQEDLTRKLAARQRIGAGYTKNIEAIKARLAEIESELNPTRALLALR